MADGKSDPRPDQSNDGPKYSNPGESESRPAEGGVGTDTKGDPAKAPDAQPKK
jgi:hypothetical protein